jgi:ribonuclease E
LQAGEIPFAEPEAQPAETTEAQAARPPEPFESEDAAPPAAAAPRDDDDAFHDDAASHDDDGPAQDEAHDETQADDDADADHHDADRGHELAAEAAPANGNGNGEPHEEEAVESLGGGDALEEMPERSYRSRRQYKIQEVIKRRQIMLVQVVKEERGTKGAALTTYLSLAGRYSVLMPNTARGGGISRKITSAEDRKRLKEVAEELEVPEGMGVILRTAGANRTKTEVKRDFEYLLRLWETIRDLTLKSTAPTLVYEEGSLVKRSIRDLYNKDIDEIIVAGDTAYRDAKDFMHMLMPSHARNVKPYHDGQPLFTRYGIESQLDAMFQPTVQLKSGGYIVLNQTEALVAIDVNSGRATREHNIEDTALKTNLEAAAEIARQLRLRDLAGLIVIDFIDMEENRNNRAVERKLKEALKSDRARIQVGRISHFGLMEMSRQRIRTSVLESSTEICPHCGGSGHVRSVSSVALQLLRSLEEQCLKGATHNLIVRTRTEVALYVLNHKRAHLRALEERFQIAISVNADSSVTGQPPFAVDRGEQVMTLDQARGLLAQPAVQPVISEEYEEELVADEAEVEADHETESADAEPAGKEPASQDEESAARGERQGREGGRRRRGRRGRGRDRERRPAEDEMQEPAQPEAFAAGPEGGEIEPSESDDGFAADAQPSDAEDGRQDSEHRRRRRGRRGGRRNRRGRENAEETNFAADNGHDAEHEASRPEAFGEHDAFSPAPPEGARVHAAPFAGAEREPEPAREEKHEPVEAKSAEPASSGSEPPAPRRRATVREPAPIFGSFAAPPSPAPAEPPPLPAAAEETPAAQDDEPARPRRRGWWSRRACSLEHDPEKGEAVFGKIMLKKTT